VNEDPNYCPDCPTCYDGCGCVCETCGADWSAEPEDEEDEEDEEPDYGYACENGCCGCCGCSCGYCLWCGDWEHAGPCADEEDACDECAECAEDCCA